MIRISPIRTLLLVPALFIISVANSQTTESGLDSVLKGNDGKLFIGAQALVKDTVFLDQALKPSILSTNKVSNIITFRIDELTNPQRLLPDSFSVAADIRVIYTNSNNLVDSVSKTLTVTYNKSRPYTARSWFYFSDACKVNVKVLALTAQYAPLDSVTRYLELENEIVLDRDYKLDCSEHSIHTVSQDISGIDTSGELAVSWPIVPVAEEYDLEWTYIDKSAIESGRYTVSGQLNADLLFRFNATRVTVAGTGYNIPLLYDGDGKLFFRVRGAQTHADGRRVTTAWSSDFVNDGGLGEYDFAGHERKLNWQSNTSFAEEGKRKSVVQYFDGSLKGRQTVTKDNTTQTTVVAETLYDKQGRPVIQVMPAPTLNSLIQFTPRFNAQLNGAEYDKGIYDTVQSAADYCAAAAPAMDTVSGASQYYSPANPKVDQGYHQYIPNAYGFAFTETKYEQDNTGRINAQGGVGREYRLGSGKETKYYYGEPDQEELDALFGTEAGDASHYQKNMVRDANGQYSVSYVDMHGRTVATALAGTAPDSLQALPSNNSTNITSSLINGTNNLIKGTAIESVRELIVTRGGQHIFNYQLNPESLGLEDCNNQTVCYDCLYDLEITVSDNCNNQNMPGDTAYRKLIRNFSLNSIDTTCNAAQAFSVTDTLNLPEGSYTVTKRLSINEEAMQYYRDSVYMLRNTCRSYEDIVNEQRSLIQEQLGDCSPDTLDEYDYQSYRRQMLEDLTPSSGQYANPDSADKGFSVFNTTASGEYVYQTVSGYKNSDGVNALVSVNGGAPVPPQQLDNQDDFISYFEDSWAEALLQLHPEYDLLVDYEKLSDSHIWDEDFEKTDTYAAALVKGYLNPTGNSSQPAVKFGSSPEDPLFAALTSQFSTGDANAARQSLDDSLMNFRSGSDGSTTKTYNLWAIATAMVKCRNEADPSACTDTWSSNTNVFGDGLCEGELNMAWRFFRNQYQQLKKEWINNFIHQRHNNLTYPGTVGFIPVFPRRESLFAQAGIADIFGTDISTYTAQAQAGLNDEIDSSCHQYAQRWVEQLGTCNYPADSLNNVIIPRLIQVCKEGGDAGHPFGASTVKPGSTYPYRSFEDVINDYNQTHGITSNTACNAYLIDLPKPNAAPLFVTELPTYQKPDSCSCERISSLHAQYVADSSRYTSFSNFMQVKYNTVIAEGALDTLVNLCNGTITCNFIPQLIKIPPALQCGAEVTCATCSLVKALYDSFTVKFPGATPALTAETGQQDTVNLLFANYMNQHLGFSKTTPEYLTFMDSCIEEQPAACDSLLLIKEEYRKILIDVRKGIAVKGYKLTPVKEELIDAMNGLLEWNHRADFNWELSPRYQVVPVSWARTNKLYSLAWSAQSGSDSVFNITFPLNLDYLKFSVSATVVNALRTGQVVNDTDFVGMLRPGDLDKKYFATGLRDEWGRFRFMWAADSAWYGTGSCGPHLGAYYGYNTPPSEYLLQLCKQISNGYLITAFYRMPQAEPTYSEYNSYRSALTSTLFKPGSGPDLDDRIPTGAFRDSLKTSTRIYQLADIRKVIDFYIDSSLLQQYNPVTNNFGDTLNTRFVRAWLQMMNGDTVSAYVYDNMVGFIYKQKVDSIIYGTDCEKGFAAYYNQRKGTSYSFAQLDSLSQAVCGIPLQVCDTAQQTVYAGGTLLCDNQPLNEEVLLYQPDACSDSTQLIATTATEIYKAYKDSLIGAFNEAYTAKCLNAANIESFTVNRPVSEYHYTLYYYDQAGNLIKTISPEGVHPNTNGTWLAEIKTKRANGERQVPDHTLPVVYRYNSLNQVVTQYSPDGGYSKFWYDRLGRLAISQNEKQLSANNYSYTRYDQLGRITEVGEKYQPTAMDNTTSRNQSSLQDWLNYTYTYNSQTILAQQVTRTVYDVVASLPTVSGTTAYTFHQKGYTLRNRVSNTLLYDVLPVSGGNPQYSEYSSGTYYSYDIHGNVDTLLNDYRLGLMAGNGANRFKLTAYNYDLISGKVNEVHYQPGEKDQFYHRYEYDAENRITDVFTTNVKEFVSTRSNEDHEAFYQYYKHGPLARTVIGQQQVQGIDYAYTLQGWLKGVNSTALMPDRDMGGDEGTLTARDAYGFNLNYFTGDYNPIHDTKMPFPGHTAYMPNGEYKALYNGNISSMAVNISPPKGGAGGGFAPQLYNYHYDQLNRIVSMDAYRGLSQTNNNWDNLFQTPDYKERVSYDANGNILAYLRNGTTAGGRPLQMDSLTYKYFEDDGNKRNNRLRMVRDAVASANYTEDIDDQLSAVNNAEDSNYVYDEIGNLVQDKSEKIDNIKWNVYGKITEIDKTATDQNPVTKISYTYDAAGNRISKKVEKGEASETTWYVRDAQGNVLGVYTDKNGLTLTEHHIYGSSRLGIANRDLTVADPSISGASLNLLGNSYLVNFDRGKKFFELTNHLGNVLVTVSDRKLQVTSNEQNGENNGGCEIGTAEDVLNVSTRNSEASYVARTEVNLLPGFESNTGDDYAAYTDNSLTTCVPYSEPELPEQGWYYAADIVSASDYYPFGSFQPNRHFSNGSYRYGFNGKENDNDVKGEGNQQDYGMRISDPRLGRFLSVDPLTKSYPWYTPYSFAGNNPIRFIDIDGQEPGDPLSQYFINDAVTTIVTKPSSTKAKVYGVALGVSGSVVSVANAVVHPVESVKGIFRIATQTPMENVIDYGIGMAEKYGDLPEPVQDYAIGANVTTDILMAVSPIKKAFSSPKVPAIALGLDEPVSGGPPRSLRRFADKESAVMHKDWDKIFGIGITKSNSALGFGEIFENVMNHIVNKNGNVKFDITNLDFDRVANDLGKSFEEASSYTDAEMNSVMNNSKYLKKTEFFENGKSVDKKIVIDKYQAALKRKANAENKN